MEAVSNIRSREEAEREKIERAEAESRAKAEAEMKEKVDNTREARAKS